MILYQRVTIAAEALYRPELTKIVAEGVDKGIFDTFDPEGVADMLLQLATSTRCLVTRAIAATTKSEIDDVISAFENRVRLHEIALDSVLGLPAGSVKLAETDYVRTIMTARQHSQPKQQLT
jgi:hypothetical protein